MTGGLVTDEARAWIGRSDPPVTVEVSATDIAKYCHAVGETASEHFDEAAARAAGYRAIVAPPGFYVAVRIGAALIRPRTALAEDGTPDADLPPIAVTQVMAGETRARFPGRIHAGDRITLEKTITGLTEKSGSSGPFVLMGLRHRLTNQLGEEVVVEDYSRILR